MTPDDVKQIADSVGGPRTLASLLRVGKDYIYRRISGESSIKYKDELAIRMLTEMEEQR